MDDGGLERELAAFAASLRWERLPGEVRERALLVLIDCAAAAAGGLAVDRNRRMAEQVAGSAPGPSTVIGRPEGCEPGYAALIHGTAGTELELDEGHRFSGGHPGIHVVPAAVALAEAEGRSGRELLAAVVAGYEVAARVGEAMQPLSPERHPHGVWGVAGAAAASARLLGLGSDGLLQAVRIAANFALNTRYDTALEGATVRNSYAGMAGLAGVAAARLAAADFTGLEAGIERGFRMFAGGFDTRKLAPPGDLGELAIARNYFKRHSACRHLHGMLDALDRLLARNPVKPEVVDSITVETYAAAARFTEARPRNALQARFSIPFGVATRLVHGGSDPAAFSDEAIDRETLALASRVAVREEPAFTAAAPRLRPTRITLRLKGGQALVEQVDLPRGDAEQPFSQQELMEKFVDLAGPVMGTGGTRKALEALCSLPEAEDVRAVFRRLRAVEADERGAHAS